MNLKYLKGIEDLENPKIGTTKFKCFGQSMSNKKLGNRTIESGSEITFERKEYYEKGDFVFCSIGNHFIDCHIIVAIKRMKNGNSYLIANSYGHENGWTTKIHGKAISAEFKGKIKPL